MRTTENRERREIELQRTEGEERERESLRTEGRYRERITEDRGKIQRNNHRGQREKREIITED